MAGSTSLLVVHEPRSNGILSTEESLPEGLLERVSALELRVREQEEAAQLSETELQAMERDLAVKDAYIRRLERGQEILAVELAQVRERAAELFEGLERAEARLAAAEGAAAEATAELVAVRAGAAYRLGDMVVALGRRLGPLGRLGRRLLSSPPTSR